MPDLERFAISTQGLKELHQGRAPWALIKEIVQNVWDEAPQATQCQMTIVPDSRPGHTLVTVDDDGPGFAQPEHAYMLMAPTPKRTNPTKRGRFNTGEKEAISVATEATITTKGKTISFPETGGRTITDNDRQKGTTVTMSMPWDPGSIPELVAMLKIFIPTDCRLTVNGEEVPFRTPLKIHPANLPTVVQQGLGQPMRYRNRDTTIHILAPLDHPAWVYEMGIPIQTTDLPFDVNVMQKVPMPPNRDTVGQAYLKHLSAEVLNAMHSTMEPLGFAETWVRTGFEDERATDQAIISTKNNRYGEKVVLWSSNTDANMRAAEAGYQIIHPKSLSTKEKETLVKVAGIKSANEVFKIDHHRGQPVQPDTVKQGFAQWVTKLAATAGLRAKVEFVHSTKANVDASCSANTLTPTVTFNTAKFPDLWFDLRGQPQLELVIHELAHALANTPMEHGPKWGNACAKLGGILSYKIPRNKNLQS